MTRFHPPIHPGEILREEFMEPHNLSLGDRKQSRSGDFKWVY